MKTTVSKYMLLGLSRKWDQEQPGKVADRRGSGRPKLDIKDERISEGGVRKGETDKGAGRKFGLTELLQLAASPQDGRPWNILSNFSEFLFPHLQRQ